jgi:hypothetical protein
MHARRKSDWQPDESLDMNGINAEKDSGLLFTMAQYMAEWPSILRDCSRLENFAAERVTAQELIIGATEEGV